MAEAKQLPSGSWRALAYSHSEQLYDDEGKEVRYENGRLKKKKIYESFTSDLPGRKGKKEAERLANLFESENKHKYNTDDYTVTVAIDKYIDSCDALLSPTTIQGYRKMQRNGFKKIMKSKLKDLTTERLQEAVNEEAKRISNRNKTSPQAISAKTVINEYGLLICVFKKYCKSLDYNVRLPQKDVKIKELPQPEVIYNIVKGTEIELPVMLAMWLSFSMSEIRGLTKSQSVDGDYLTIREVVVDVNGAPLRKGKAKQPTRIRRHEMPVYIKELINRVETDELVTLSGHAIYCRFIRLLEKNSIPHMTFHDLRHINASVMALLQIPDKYAQERGGWKTDYTMKKVYTHTFSQERIAADNKVNNYFVKSLNLDTTHYNPICIAKISESAYLFIVNGLERIAHIGDRIQIKYEKNNAIINARGYLTEISLDSLVMGNRKFDMPLVRDFLVTTQHEPQHKK